MLKSIYTYSSLSLKQHLDKCKLGAFFGVEGLEIFSQHEDTLDFNVFTYKMENFKIQNS
jgi:hypothetical protein